MKLSRQFAIIGLAAALGACSLSGLLGGGGKPPVTLQTLTPEAPDPGPIARSASAGQAVTIATPIISNELNTVRVPVQISPTDVQYVTNLQWVDTPDKLFQDLVEETVRRTTGRVVLDPNQTGLDPGLTLHGELQRFGYDAQTGQVAVVYNGSLATADGAQVQTRRFVATAPSDGTGPSVGPALNHAANQVALDVAKWIGGSTTSGGHEVNAVAFADLGDLRSVLRQAPHFVVQLAEELRSVGGSGKDQDLCRHVRGSLESVHGVAGQVVEVALARSHLTAVDVEIDLAFKDVISFVPVVPVRRRAHSVGNLLLE